MVHIYGQMKQSFSRISDLVFGEEVGGVGGGGCSGAAEEGLEVLVVAEFEVPESVHFHLDLGRRLPWLSDITSATS